MSRVLGEPFEPEHLSISHDFMKMDIEGNEIELLSDSVQSIKPCRMELHEKLLGHDTCAQNNTEIYAQKHRRHDMGY